MIKSCSSNKYHRKGVIMSMKDILERKMAMRETFFWDFSQEDIL